MSELMMLVRWEERWDEYFIRIGEYDVARVYELGTIPGECWRAKIGQRASTKHATKECAIAAVERVLGVVRAE